MIDCSKTENYFTEKLRMTKRTKEGVCGIKCNVCPLYSKGLTCSTLEMYQPEKAIAIVQKWSDEHPQKTYLTEFLKHYPNALLTDLGTPKWVCPHHLGLMSIYDCTQYYYDDCSKDYNCKKCWNQPVEESECV